MKKRESKAVKKVLNKEENMREKMSRTVTSYWTIDQWPENWEAEIDDGSPPSSQVIPPEER